MKKLFQEYKSTIWVLGVLCLVSCGTTKTNYQKEYAKVWKELIKTKAWQETLNVNKTDSKKEFYASSDNGVSLATEIKRESSFDHKYQVLVSKAYFKIITEAEKADARISADYRIIKDGESSMKVSKKQVQEITKKYEAHKAMLSGLKSWNIFSENRSGDLDYFKEENESEIQRMINAGETDHQIVNYLIYKLADLYHIEEN